jgi:hypothetical protein
MDITPEIIKRFRTLFPEEAPFLSDADIKEVIDLNQRANVDTHMPSPSPQGTLPPEVFNQHLMTLYGSVMGFLEGKGINLRNREARRIARKKFRCNYK